ncbi:hypothetical protein CAPTEDRAFT_224660 [Capitella teleta]|uniref:Uncharacterized protein n=1 Tax=Capitella teleta TaxID=283909 RepID=R7VCC4_CAPTE|nr:hypothetical protein CAPTEDRAFT_224660 [Capitella teleta]|eukprot:ELU16182.1 hypothetical protein CAPTEDRAFT_224660 [Capitella teleta]
MSAIFTKSDLPWGSSRMACTKCVFRDREYSSASEALEAYIREYEGRPSPPPRSTERDVQELLMTASQRKEATVVLERETEKMLRMKELVEESYQQLLNQQKGLSCSPAEEQVLSHSQLDSIRGRVQEGYGVSDVPSTQFDDLHKTLGLHEHTGLKLPSMGDKSCDASSSSSSIVAGHMTSVLPSSKMASTPIRHGALDFTKSSVASSSLKLSDLRPVKHFSGYTTDDIVTRSRSQSRSNYDRSRSLSAAESTRIKSPSVDEKHQQFLDNLMCDIERSSDTVLPETTLKSSANKSVHFWDDAQQEESRGEQRSFDYLARIQRLIQPPQCASPTTEEILDGDRSWEQIPPVNMDDFAEVGGGEDLAKVTDANVDAILDECVSLVSQHDQCGTPWYQVQ